MTTFAELQQRLSSYQVRAFGRGASAADLGRAETDLGVPLAGGYRDFLLHFGWGGVKHLELFGLGDDAPSFLQLVPVTLSERTEMRPMLRPHFIPVMNDGGGNLYCIDTTVSPEPPIVFWDHEGSEDQILETYGANFVDWLGQMLDEL